MKKILITGTFEGSVTLLYGEPGVGADAWPPLLAVEFGNAVLNDMQKAYLLKVSPVRYGAGFEQAFNSNKLRFHESDRELDWEEDFYKPYGKKVNPDRVLKEWKKLTKAYQSLAVFRRPAYDRYLVREGTGKADPENYLKKKLFLNDYDNL